MLYNNTVNQRYYIIVRPCEMGPVGTLLTVVDGDQQQLKCESHYACIMECLGQSLEQADYLDLYEAIGDTYGRVVTVDEDGALCMDNEAVELWMFQLPNLQAKISK